MRKFYLLMLTLLSAVGAWAQTVGIQVSANVDDPEYQYLIMAEGPKKFMDSGTKPADGASAGRFAFFAGTRANEYKLYNIDNQKWISYTMAGSYSNGKGFATLIDKDNKDNANVWVATLVQIGNKCVYQFAPRNTNGVAAKYMNWYNGVNNYGDNTVGIYETGASNDTGSRWILGLAPKSGNTYFLQDTHGVYLNLKQLGVEANDPDNSTQLATLTKDAVAAKITITNTGKWKLSVNDQGTEKFLGRASGTRNWNSWVADDADRSNFEWIAVATHDDGQICYTLASTAENTEEKYLGCDNHETRQSLYVNQRATNQLKLAVIDGQATPVSFRYAYKFNGVKKLEEEVSSWDNFLYPKLTKMPYGLNYTLPSGLVNTSVSGQELDVVTTVNVPFVAAESPSGIVKWYYLKMHSNNQRYIQYLSDQTYIEWGDQKLDINNIGSHMWAFVGNPYDGFKLVNKAAGIDKALSSAGSGDPSMADYANATAYVYSKSSENVNNGFCMRVGTGNYLNGDANNMKVLHYSANDAGSTIVADAAIPVKFSTNTEKYYYALKSGRPGNYWYTLTNDDKIILDTYTGAETQLWYFTATQDGNNTYVRLLPKTGNGKAMSYQITVDETTGNETIADGADKIVAKELTSDWTNTWNFKFTNNGAPYGLQTSNGANWLSNNGGVANNQGVKNKMGLYNSQSDQGSQIYIYDVLPCTLTESNGTKYDVTATTPVASEPAVSVLGIPASYISNAVNDGTKITADVTFPFPVSSVSNIKPTMISAFNAETYKWYAEADAVKEKKDKVANSSDLATFLWAIYPKIENKAFLFTIKNVATGKYINSTSSADSHNANVVTLAETGSDFTIDEANQFKLSTGKYLSFNSSTASDAQLMGTHSTHIGTKNTFPVTSFTAQITAAKAATLYTPVAVNIPANVVAKYPSSQDNNGVLVYETLSDVIPAGAAVVLTGDAATYTFNAATTEGTPLSGNMLFGYATKTPVSGSGHSGSVYALASKTPGVGFYEYAGTNYIAGKAYLEVPAGSARGFYSIFDEDNAETGINAIESEELAPANAAIYDLSGRRVQSAKSGLYIVGGKKIVK